ncbi:DUF3883 domain-containing protein [Schlesneria paludicola]|uniref:DUF3883 domain-containing protein n=1 Tax=Schlesneria paludicola TaxID=360056 RepID=UPI00029A6A2D|nr:DUF3883 domain-containing protein [Schlesneria paludicola]
MADSNPDQPQMGQNWSEQEVRLVVADYFTMLESELLGVPYKKSDHRKILAPHLSGRSDGSIEFKHQNVSGVLVDFGLPYIEGYKPRSNYQSILATEVESFLEKRPDFWQQVAAGPILNPVEPPPNKQTKFEDVIEEPPEQIIVPKSDSKPWITRKPRRIDFAERDATNRRLGLIGEEFVLELEISRLLSLGRDDLAKKVTWASRDIGDGLGFDIISFDETDESEKLLEVKATGLGKFFPFHVSSNEVRCSEDVPQQFHLYRVFDIARQPRLYILKGSLRVSCQLQPVLYRGVS